MIKILHVGLSSNPGGVENLMLNYFRNMDKTQFTFDFADIYGDGLAFAEDIQTLGGQVITLPNYKQKTVLFIQEFNRFLENHHYDIIHIHMQSAANILPVLVAKKQCANVICHSHSSSTPNGLLRKVLNATNTTILRNLRVHKWACGIKAGEWMWGGHFDKDYVLPNAVDMRKFAFDSVLRNQSREQLKLQPEDKVLGFIGRFGDEKNVFFLIDVLEKLLQKSAQYKLVTVGEGELLQSFVEEVSKKGLEDSVHCLGKRSDTAVWYQAFDAFVLPSFFEGFPVVAVEAQTSHLPVFLSANISKEVAISDQVSFLPLDSAEKWADKIEYVLDDYQRARRQIIDERFDIRNATNLLEEKYCQLVDR
ncbi:glycosyltransferase [Streptococcus ovis]|uniref:glycosyltransferase n=1 Tax=Streptococcus ovis TaxID=82806 RepID=UPI00037A01E1|nr:glycosyltransferase [Streptococcus ovis]